MTSLKSRRDKLAHSRALSLKQKYNDHAIDVYTNAKRPYIKGFDAAISELKKWCPCGGVILADTEDWPVPMCNGCYEFVRKEIRAELKPEIDELVRAAELGLSFAPKGKPEPNLAPMFYHTLDYSSEVELQNRIDAARELLTKFKEIMNETKEIK